MLPIYHLLFVASFLAYVTLAAVLLLPISPLARFRPVPRVLLISSAVSLEGVAADPETGLVAVGPLLFGSSLIENGPARAVVLCKGARVLRR